MNIPKFIRRSVICLGICLTTCGVASCVSEKSYNAIKLVSDTGGVLYQIAKVIKKPNEVTYYFSSLGGSRDIAVSDKSGKHSANF